MTELLGAISPVVLFVVAVVVATRRSGVFGSFTRDKTRGTSKKLAQLRRSSFLASGSETFFYALQWSSVSTWKYGTRAASNNTSNGDVERDERAKFVECLVVFWLSICGLGLLLTAYAPTNLPLRNAFLCCAILRSVDIVQAQINGHIWDSVRIETDEKVASLQRSLLLAGINYLEFIGWFAIVYHALQLVTVSCGSNQSSPCHPGTLDTLYFSAITQLTIGYGEMTPAKLGKLLAPVQAVVGTMLLVVGVARLLAGVKAPAGGA